MLQAIEGPRWPLMVSYTAEVQRFLWFEDCQACPTLKIVPPFLLTHPHHPFQETQFLYKCLDSTPLLSLPPSLSPSPISPLVITLQPTHFVLSPLVHFKEGEAFLRLFLQSSPYTAAPISSREAPLQPSFWMEIEKPQTQCQQPSLEERGSGVP